MVLCPWGLWTSGIMPARQCEAASLWQQCRSAQAVLHGLQQAYGTAWAALRCLKLLSIFSCRYQAGMPSCQTCASGSHFTLPSFICSPSQKLNSQPVEWRLLCHHRLLSRGESTLCQADALWCWMCLKSLTGNWLLQNFLRNISHPREHFHVSCNALQACSLVIG